MSLSFRMCPVCKGHGELYLRKTRVSRLINRENTPLLDDSVEKCSLCKGTGRLYVKINPFFKPWNPFGRDDNE